MAESLSRLNQGEKYGVCPFGAQGRVTVGVSEKPLSSTKTRGVPRRSAFFYLRPDVALPVGDGRLVALERPPFRLLAAPAESPQQPPDGGGMIGPPRAARSRRQPAGWSRGRCGSLPLGGPARAGVPGAVSGAGPTGGSARRWLWRQPLGSGPLVGLAPAHDRTVGAAQLLRHRQRGEAPLSQLDGPSATPLQLTGAARRSHASSGN